MSTPCVMGLRYAPLACRQRSRSERCAQVEFIEESAIPIAMVGLLQALPGTQLYRRLESEGRLVSDANGNNIDCNLSFIPTMSAQCLLDGYRSILKRIYAPDAYYDRVRRFLERYQPTRTRRSLSEYIALCRSVVKQGILGDARASYWKSKLSTSWPHPCLQAHAGADVLLYIR